jgi:LruC domain-containing protein
MNRHHLVPLALLGLAAAVPAQDELVPIPDAVLDAIGRVLPERSNAGAAFLAPGAGSNLVCRDAAQVRVLFAWENSSYRNSLGWFSWRVGEDGTVEILDSAMLFPEVERAPRGPLRSGAAVWLRDGDGERRTFAAGERIGFFLVADGYGTARSAVTGWRPELGLPAADPGLNRGLGRGLFTTIPEINPEAAVDDGARSGHVAMVRMPGRQDFLGGAETLLLGFEDLDRTRGSDDDFNDAVFVIDVQPPSAIDLSGVALYDPSDRDGDGVAGVADVFPDDPDRAWLRRVPAQGHAVIAFEDFYPVAGDEDYNDAVLAFAVTTVLDARNRVRDMIVDYHLVARGASFDHEFGLRLPGLPRGADGTVRIERFMSGAQLPGPVELRRLAAGPDGRIDRIFASTVAALPRATPDKPFANTWPGHPEVPAASARLWITFDAPVAETSLGAAPYDPFLIVTATDGTRADVHLVGFSSFADRSPGLPKESGAQAFIDDNGNPWAILVPSDWSCPLEGVRVGQAYPQFEVWRDSRGRQARDWFEHPTSAAASIAVPIASLIPRRVWTLRGPEDRF